MKPEFPNIVPGAWVQLWRRGTWLFDACDPSRVIVHINVTESLFVIGRLGAAWNWIQEVGPDQDPNNERVLVLTQNNKIGFVYIDLLKLITS